jgi:peptidoglycan LD-endopeptidase CwlK
MSAYNARLERLKGCHPDLVRKVRAVITDLQGHGLRPVVVEGLRTPERQAALYAQGRTKPGKIVTDTLVSKHILGKAADIVWADKRGQPTWDAPAAHWDLLGSAAEAHNLEWGGRWRRRDFPHVQLRSKG